MKRLLTVTTVMALTVASVGCTCHRNTQQQQCRPAYVQPQVQCYDPCATPGAVMSSGPTMMPSGAIPAQTIPGPAAYAPVVTQ